MHTGSNALYCRIAQTQEHMLQAIAVRSICFNHEQSLPYFQSFDGNDLSSTHVICYDGNEPIGALRVRWFKDFAKIERTCVVPRYRKSQALKLMDIFVHDLIAMKGYTVSITHAETIYAKLWSRLFGYSINQEKGAFEIPGSEKTYFELYKTLTPPPEAVSINSDATVLSRLEGSWESPSPLG